MATAASSSVESEALKRAFDYLVDSIDTASVLPKSLHLGLIKEPQRSDCASPYSNEYLCASEPDPHKKAEKFLGHLQRKVNGDSSKYHVFTHILKETGQHNIASRLDGE